MSILDNEEKILNNSDWLVEREKVYDLINQLQTRLINENIALRGRLNDLENKNAELRAELDFIKRNITFSKPVDFYQQCEGEYSAHIRF